MVTAEDLRGALPTLEGTLALDGLAGAVEVWRDGLGIPYVRAGGEADAFFAQGFVTAQDRLWQMEYDRRRGGGRWAEVVGRSAMPQDKLMRRFSLTASAQADYAAASAATRAVFDAYAAGVNAFIDGPDPLPAEYSIAGITPEPWRPWHGLLVYKVRHILMGVFESKVWRARLVQAIGPERAGALFPGYEPGWRLILPPGAVSSGPMDEGLRELAEGAAALNLLAEMDAGSNSWTLAGGRTATGQPLLAGDSHRGLDTPNAYYQNRLACPEFDVAGLSFPGVPGFPHFGHNPWVCWSVTHTAADYQDLYIERFRPGPPPQYLYKGEWHPAEVRTETVHSREGDAETIEVVTTRHGPVIAGKPEDGAALALKYTATEIPGSPWADILPLMLRARSADELVESQRGWVDPVNNFLFADTGGNMGYLCRGRIPLRSRLNGWLPAPGWTGEQEWQGDIPFEELPRSVNPPEGYIATANNRPVGDDYPHYIAVDFTPEYRVRSVTEALNALEKPGPSDMASVHAQQISRPAQVYLRRLPEAQPTTAASARAQGWLSVWDGRMDAGMVGPALYSALRDALLREVLQVNLPPELAEAAWHPADRGLGSFGNRLKARLATLLDDDDRRLLRPGDTWPQALARALRGGTAALAEQLGGDMHEWRWGRLHRARPRHTLSAAWPELAALLDPPEIPASGDGDTPLAGGYSPAAPATITSLSVARYVFDPSNWDNSQWIVPLGSSGHPASPHYHDQSETWRAVKMRPMLWDWQKVTAAAETHQKLEPKPA